MGWMSEDVRMDTLLERLALDKLLTRNFAWCTQDSVDESCWIMRQDLAMIRVKTLPTLAVSL